MSLSGSLADCSLPEIFHLIEKGKKTGLLSLGTLPNSPIGSPPVRYIWVERGCLVAAAKNLDDRGLAAQIERNHWVRNHGVNQLAQLYCSWDQPLGLCLQHHGILQPEQLKQLFRIQVLQQVCALLQFKEGWFKFERDVPVPPREMTGLSIPATQALSSCQVRFLGISISELFVKSSRSKHIPLDEQYSLMTLLLEESCTEEERDAIIRMLRNANRRNRRGRKLA
ncbi:MAG TPA: hypothetical protein DDZ80_27780 [Cyanobacteria bacterium UBA8803]|nr:hypothetical protein [Cyanobacteria bacterium UBA9273]HBL62068.1 hypothetical protein [Cyanobacteria bacterium UBA8803]